MYKTHLRKRFWTPEMAAAQKKPSERSGGSEEREGSRSRAHACRDATDLFNMTCNIPMRRNLTLLATRTKQ
jgi:hypothetical protein